jgi:hypothetical protein
LCFQDILLQVQSRKIQGVSNMTGTNCDLFTHNQSRSYLNHLVIIVRDMQYIKEWENLEDWDFERRSRRWDENIIQVVKNVYCSNMYAHQCLCYWNRWFL